MRMTFKVGGSGGAAGQSEALRTPHRRFPRKTAPRKTGFAPPQHLKIHSAFQIKAFNLTKRLTFTKQFIIMKMLKRCFIYSPKFQEE